MIKKLKMVGSLQTMSNKTYEVYIVKDKDGNPLYIGQGLCGRHNHCTSGVSHVYELNRLHHTKGQIYITILHKNLTEDDSKNIETHLIKTMFPIFNKVGYNFRRLGKELWELEHCEQTEDIVTKREIILSLNKGLKELYEELGVDVIKATGFNQTKCKHKLMRHRGIHPEDIAKLDALKKLKLKVGNFYTYTELRDKVKSVYDSEGINNGAKATDINTIYVTKKTARNKVQGFLIVSKI